MKECFVCGATEDSKEMLEVIYKTGVSNICVDCYPKYKLPIIEKKRINWTELDNDRRLSVRERLSKIAHVDSAQKSSVQVGAVKNPEDMTLRDIVEKNFEKDQIKKSEVPKELVDNFHWIIMRRRRSMGLSHAQFAEKIHEPEVIVSSLEKGVLPKEYHSLLKKVESVLSVRLFKDLSRDINHEDIIAESKVPTGILVSEVKARSGMFKNLFRKKESVDDKIQKELASLDESDEETMDAEDMSLEKVKDFVGEPVEEYSKTENQPKEEKKDQISGINPAEKKEDLNQDDISSLIWRN